jgi:hypothetical protein
MIEKGWQGVQLRVESPAVKRRLYVCCSTVIFGETVIVPVLKSVARKQLVETVIDRGH